MENQRITEQSDHPSTAVGADRRSKVVQLYRRLTVPAADPRWNARLAGRLRLAA